MKKSKKQEIRHLNQPIQSVKSVSAHPNNLDFILGILLFVVMFTAYQPAWKGAPIWDDDSHITRPDLRSFDGLSRIWTQLGATQQYYPLTHSLFWLEYHLWGDSTLGYHFVNILLHFFSTLLLVFILRRLLIPGAWFVAAIFALHPVQVESIAWISELKNALSGVFYLSALLTYLHYDKTRKRKPYSIALSLFILGLLSKSVIATLPVSLLIIFWWKRGKIDWKNDIVPLLPFFTIGIASGIFTAWVEHNFIIGVEANTFTLTFIERGLIAGRVIWFYVYKLLWPLNLIFTYPRWDVSQAIWWQYLFPVATVAIAGALWKLRNYSRAPFAAFLYFAATLFPALGFFNVYPFRYSFVADHFQYLACIGPIALAIGISLKINILKEKFRWMLCIIILLVLSALTWKQSKMYIDAETLYRTTIKKAPNCLMAHNNLGAILEAKGKTDEAIVHFRKTLEINPDFAEAWNNLGNASSHIGQIDDAMTDYQKALSINPNYAEAHNNLGTILATTGHLDEAIAHYRKALEIKPIFAEAWNNLGDALLQTGQVDEAMLNFKRALEYNPEYAEAHYNLGNILLKYRQINEAIEQFTKALEINPNYEKAQNNLGNALFVLGQIDEAIYHYQKALEINPNKINTLQNLADALARKGQIADAISVLQKALQLAKSSGQQQLCSEITATIDKLNHASHSIPQAR